MKNKKRGFSLVEILLGLSLFSVLIVTATTIMISSIRESRKSAAIALAKTEGAYALRAIEQQVRYAGSVECPAGGLNLVVHKLGSNNLVAYGLDTINHQLASSSSNLTSKEVAVSLGSPQVCANVFTCTSNSVSICFVIDAVNGVDVTDKAGINGITFHSMITLVNITQ
jgi:prepilin-type N-terminal cleavage/methylation domain-containing protein